MALERPDFVHAAASVSTTPVIAFRNQSGDFVSVVGVLATVIELTLGPGRGIDADSCNVQATLRAPGGGFILNVIHISDEVKRVSFLPIPGEGAFVGDFDIVIFRITA